MRSSRSLSSLRLSQRSLARVCCLVFILSLIPLVLIAFYNYPADDDFAFALDAARAWLSTGSLGATLSAMVGKTIETYNIWQGNFVSTFFFSVSPIVFSPDLYFLSSWLILALLCLSIGYMVKGVTETLLHAGRDVFWIVYTAVMVLVLQFMPSIGYSVYWHNGGMYTVAACTLFWLQGVLCRCLAPQSRGRMIARCVWAGLAGFMLGGSFYGPMLGAAVLLMLETIAALVRRAKNRLPCTVAAVFMLLSLVISVIAPGNTLRQERTGDILSPLMTVVTAVTDSFDVAGSFMTPQLLAMLMLILPALWQPLKKSGYTFRHPLAVLIALYGLFSATLAPGLFTGFGYTTERYYNVIYFYFLMMIIGSAVYGEGALIRALEKRRDAAVTVHDSFGQRFTSGYLALCLALLAFGGFGYTIMNTSSLSAAKSLMTGEAAGFKQKMDARRQSLLAMDIEHLSAEPLEHQPYVFKKDRLPWQGEYGRIRYMKWYFEAFEE